MTAQPAPKLKRDDRTGPPALPPETATRATRATRQKRGFALLADRDPEALRELSAKGARAAHAKGVAHEYDEDEARAAGRKGGLRTQAKRRVAGNAGKERAHASR